ncbi:MAG: ABC transporter ATP-binding protein [Planctomycetota bacterium]
MSDQPLLDVRELKKHFPIRKGVLRRVKGWVRAVDGVSFRVQAGRTVGLVGESGCGKTTCGRTILRLLEPTSGRVYFDGRPVHRLSGSEMRPLRRRMQVIFQDPFSSLNPRMKVEDIVGEPLSIHGIARGAERRGMVADLLERVGLSGAYLNHYPHEFSGGQRQRVGIARALALDPDFIVCDEPVSALDVSIQAQIINLLTDIQRERDISYLFIAHDLSVVEHISHEVLVMYLGKIVERAPRELLYGDARHPYTRTLLAAVPSADPEQAGGMGGRAEEAASTEEAAAGCPFRPRCPVAERRCEHEEPPVVEVEEGHFVRCWRAG